MTTSSKSRSDCESRVPSLVNGDRLDELVEFVNGQIVGVGHTVEHGRRPAKSEISHVLPSTDQGRERM